MKFKNHLRLIGNDSPLSFQPSLSESRNPDYLISYNPNPDIENTMLAQVLDAPRKSIKSLITNKMTTVFMACLCTLITCTIKRISISGFGYRAKQNYSRYNLTCSNKHWINLLHPCSNSFGLLTHSKTAILPFGSAFARMTSRGRIVTLIFVLLLCSSTLFAQIGITPRILELDNSDISKSHSFKLLNLSKNELQINVAVENWHMTNANKPVITAPTENSLDQWIIVNPLAFTIPAGSSQTVRIAFFPPATLLAGEYRTMIYFNQVIQAQEKKGLIRSKFKLGAAVYIQVGDKQPQGEILSIWHKDKNIMLDINNQGNTHIRYSGNWSLWQASHYPTSDSIAKLRLHKDSVTKVDGLLEVGKLPGNSILPGTQRTVVFPVDYLGNGNKQKLILHIDGHMAGVKIIKTYPIE